MNILRLSMFRLKRNRKEAFAIAFLTLITAMMLGIFMTNISKANIAFDKGFSESGSLEYCFLLPNENYRDEYRDLLEGTEGVRNTTEEKCLFSLANDIEHKGEKISVNSFFVTEKTERHIESFVKREKLSDEEIAELFHPIWMPVCFSVAQGYDPGDEVNIYVNGKAYPFEIAGFYESGLMSDTSLFVKFIITEDDYALFKMLLTSTGDGEYTGLWFDSETEFDYDSYVNECTAATSENERAAYQDDNYEVEKINVHQFIDLLLYLLGFFSAVTMLSAAFVIMHRISNDIEDQMQQIGVLEALGYRSRDISLSYVGEYLISGGIGAGLGGIGTLLVSPAMDRGIEVMMGRTVTGSLEIGRTLLSVIIVTAAVIVFALIKAAKVKKYPPVTALRKGISAHHFGKNIVPLEKSRSINIFLALKSYFGDLRSALSVSVCVILSGVAMLFCTNSFDFFKDGIDGLLSMTGTDMTTTVELVKGVDTEMMRREAEKMPEVRKALISWTGLMDDASIKGSGYSAYIQVFEDYSQAEDFSPARGRFPEHDNEVMITVRRSRTEGLDVGDSIILEGSGTEIKYIITGVTSSLMNNGMGIYLTTEGYLRYEPNAVSNTLSVYLADGITEESFRESLTKRFGKTVTDAIDAVPQDDSLEERIRATAESKLATLVAYYGVTNADYAITVGDTTFTGNSRGFLIKDTSSLRGLAEMSMAPIARITKIATFIATFVIAGIVAVILSLIVSSNVKRQRKQLGIMKGLGYTSKDLMVQLALKTMPMTIISVIIASVLIHYIYSAFWLLAFGTLGNISIPVTVVTDIVLILFCYIVTYICAGKVKAITVTELMTE